MAEADALDTDPWGPHPAKRAAAQGAQTAEQLITAQADAGMSADAIAERHDDIAASLLSEASAADGRAFADGYGWTADALAADLRELNRPEPDRTPGAPHPDPFLAGRGRQACEHWCGVYVRRLSQAQPDIEREAG